MKLPVLLATLALSSAAIAQTEMPPGFNHPPMAGHPAAPAAPTPAPAAPYKFNPYSLIPAAPMAPMAPVPPPSIEGTVISAQSAGGYTYIEVTSPSGNTWLAAPETQLTAGERIRYSSGAMMHNFSSKALGRSFPSILFVGKVTPAGSEPAPAAAAGVGAAPMAAPAAAPAAPQLSEGTVVSLQDAGGYSYIEVSGAAGNVWLAAPMTKLKVGDKLRYENGGEMRNFSSRALNRTFPSIVFVDRVTVVN